MNKKFIIAGIFIIFCCVIFFFLINPRYKVVDKQQDIKSELDKRIDLWEQYVKDNGFSDFTLNEYYRSIIDLGIPVLPYLMEKIEKGMWQLGDGVTIITKKRFEEYEKPYLSAYDSKSTAIALTKWWPKAKKDTKFKFDKLCEEKTDFYNKGNFKESKEKLENIRGLGIAALPYIMDKIKQGDNELIEITSRLTNGKLKKDSTPKECLEWWQKNKEDWLIPFPNKQPKANAGRDVEAESGKQVRLDGSNSSDPDNDWLEFSWSQTSGPTVKLDDPNSVKPEFTAPVMDKQTVLTFELIVNDGNPIKSMYQSSESGQSNPAFVKITIKPKK